MLLHLVTDPRLDRARLLAAVEAAAANGIDWIQVRDHGSTARELFELTSAVIAIARPRGVKVAVNDRVDVALAAGADGVQLGGRSLPIDVVRRIAPDLRIGASVHDLAGAERASGADWLTFGHVFETSSHPQEPARGLDALAAVVHRVSIPVIAIGGINRDNIEAVRRSGASGVAVISAILNAPDPGEATAALRAELDRSDTARGHTQPR
jgi:thiamine-phosphate diphosphorylase